MLWDNSRMMVLSGHCVNRRLNALNSYCRGAGMSGMADGGLCSVLVGVGGGVSGMGRL